MYEKLLLMPGWKMHFEVLAHESNLDLGIYSHSMFLSLIFLFSVLLSVSLAPSLSLSLNVVRAFYSSVFRLLATISLSLAGPYSSQLLRPYFGPGAIGSK